MNIIFGIIIGLLILMFLVVAHEFGHFIMARRNGVKVNEFGIGFPPRAIAWVKKPISNTDGQKPAQTEWVRLPKSEWGQPQDGLVFSLNWLPIGGFCAMDGESAADKRKGTFGASSFWAKTKILFGGVLMNWLVAFLVLTILAWTGMPQFIPHQFYLGQDAQMIESIHSVVVEKVIEDSPAATAGFLEGDQIVCIGGTSNGASISCADDATLVTSPLDVTNYGAAHAGESVVYTVQRDDTVLALTAQLNDLDADYVLGVQMASYGQQLIRSTWSAPIVGAGLTVQLTGETFKGLGELLWNLISGVARQFSFNDEVREAGRTDIGAVGDSVSGPVGIVGVIFPAFAESGPTNLAFLAALISISLACMNVLPIPALDGGRWLLIAIYKLRRKELSKATEEKIVSRAFMVLIVLIMLITILDIFKFF